MTDFTYSDLFPSPYLKSDDVGEGELTLTITDIAIEEIGQDRKPKPVLSFKESDKKLVLNATNGAVIRDLYDEPYDWPGKRITLYTTEVSYAGKTTIGVRVRKRVPQTHSAAVQAVTEPEAPPPWEE